MEMLLVLVFVAALCAAAALLGWFSYRRIPRKAKRRFTNDSSPPPQDTVSTVSINPYLRRVVEVKLDLPVLQPKIITQVILPCVREDMNSSYQWQGGDALIVPVEKDTGIKPQEARVIRNEKNKPIGTHLTVRALTEDEDYLSDAPSKLNRKFADAAFKKRLLQKITERLRSPKNST